MPLHTHVFSFTHNAVVLSGFRCVHPENQTKIFDFYILWIKTNVAYTRLVMIARTKYCTTTTASNWFVTLYCKLLPAVRSPFKHGRWRSSLLLYSISMFVGGFRGERGSKSPLFGGLASPKSILATDLSAWTDNINSVVPLMEINDHS